MNPSLKIILVVLISFEISFTRSITANLILILVSLIILIILKTAPKKILLMFLLPLIPATALAITIAFYTPAHDYHFALVLFSRMFAYVMLGATFTQTTSPIELAHSLEQNLHLPSKFAYGSLAAFGVLPKMKTTIITLKKAALMRGVTLSFWSPSLYFKALLVALNWSQDLAEAMTSHGFVEDAPRTFAHQIKIKHLDWVILIGGIIVIQPFLFLFA